MLRVVNNLGSKAVRAYAFDISQVQHTLTLSYEQRVKGRVRVMSDQQQEVGLFLERGRLLQAGDLLETEQGERILVRAKAEQLCEASADDWVVFARCCYHLGNRHVPLEVGHRVLRFQADHVLEEMVVGLGLSLRTVLAPFNPEQGAYAGGHAANAQAHAHASSHAHPHPDDHDHGH